MNWFKRLCLFVFGLAGILSLVALSLVWVGPWTTQARTLITENRGYFIALEVLVCITAAGLIGCVLVALFAPRNPKETIVANVTGGDITVTRTAIISQTRHIIEADGTCSVVSIHVKMRAHGNIRVHAKVRPHLPINVVERGEILYAELEQGLAKVCGDSVRSIGLVFTEPEQQGTLSMYVESEEEAHGRTDTAANTVASTTHAQPAGEITVPMSAPVEPVVQAVGEPEVQTAEVPADLGAATTEEHVEPILVQEQVVESFEPELAEEEAAASQDTVNLAQTEPEQRETDGADETAEEV